MERKEFERILSILQNEYFYDIDGDDIKNDEVMTYFKLLGKPIERGIDVQKHRWYETSINVYKLGDWFIGIYHVSDMYSDRSSLEDFEEYVYIFEMEREEIKKYIYRPKRIY